MQKQNYARFSKAAGLPTQHARMETAGFTWKHGKAAEDTVKRAEINHVNWLKSIGAEGTTLKSLDKYRAAKYNNTAEYQLLSGYNKAVQKGDISPIVGFDLYKRTSDDIQEKLVGQTTSTGVKIQGFATHFIDRVIGQTSESRKGMRCGVPIEDVLDALTNPVDKGKIRTLENGDIRQTFIGQKADVTISIRDAKLIQTNPS